MRLSSRLPQQPLSARSQAASPQDSLGNDPVVLESSHPYEASEREIFHVTVPGAMFLTIEFDIKCNLAPGDYVQIFSDEVCKQAVSDKLSGSIMMSPNPPVLVFTGSSCSLSFESQAANAGQCWGFRCLVRGHTFSALSVSATSWQSYVTSASLLLAAQIAAALFRDSDSASTVFPTDAERSCAVFASGIRQLPADLLEVMSSADLADPATSVTMFCKSLARAGLSVLSRSLLDGEPNDDARALLERLVGPQTSAGASQELHPQVHIRQEAIARAHAIVFATLVFVGNQDMDQISAEDAITLWTAARRIGNHVVHEQQRIKNEWMDVDSESNAALEQLSQSAFDQVLRALRDKAYLVVAVAPRKVAPDVPLQAAERKAQIEDVLCFLTARLGAREVLAEMLARRETMNARIQALKGFSSALDSPRIDDDLRSDMLQLLSAEVDCKSLETTCMSEKSLRDEVVD